MHDYDTTAAVGRRRQYKFIYYMCVCVRIKPLQYKALENINHTVWVWVRYRYLYIWRVGEETSDIFILTFMYHFYLDHVHSTGNRYWIISSPPIPTRNPIETLFDFCSATSPQRYPYYHRRKMNVRTREIILKETATTIFFFLFLYFFLSFFFFVFWDDDHVPTVKNWIEIYCNRNNPRSSSLSWISYDIFTHGLPQRVII